MPKKVYFTLAALIFLPTVIFINLVSGVSAVSLTKLSDTLTRLQKGELASHTIQFILPETERFDVKEYIEYNFGDDKGKWVINRENSSVSDFNFYDGSERTIVGVDGDCTDHFGFDDVVIEIDDKTKIVKLTPCKNFVSNLAGTEITFEIGSAAGGKDIIINPTEAGSTIIKITHLNQASETNFGQLAIPIMEFDGVGSTLPGNDLNPTVLGSQTVNITHKKISADSLTIIQKTKETSLSSETNLTIEDCFFTNFTSTIPNF